MTKDPQSPSLVERVAMTPEPGLREALAETIYNALWPENKPAVRWVSILNKPAKACVYEAADAILTGPLATVLGELEEARKASQSQPSADAGTHIPRSPRPQSHIVPKPTETRAQAETWLTSVYGAKPTRNQLLDEICDYRMVMRTASLVYDHITRGAISKVNTDSDVIIAHADDIATADIEEAVREVREALADAPAEASPLPTERESSRDQASSEARTQAAEARIAELEGEGWRPIQTAPRDGQHILVGTFGDSAGTGFGWAGPRDVLTGLRAQQPWQDVAHWFDDPEDPGLYSSYFGGDQQRPFDALTHWRPLPDPPALNTLPLGLGRGDRGASVAETGGSSPLRATKSDSDGGH
jgi:hypothetical protein